MPRIIKASIERDGSIHLLEAVRLAQPVEVDLSKPYSQNNDYEGKLYLCRDDEE